MNVCVIGGAGYVGLITGLCLAEIGHRVINVDVDEKRIQELQVGKPDIYEDGIELLLRRNLDAGRFQFSNNLGPVVGSSDVVFPDRLNLLRGVKGIHVDIPYSRTNLEHIPRCLEALWHRGELVEEDLVLVTALSYPTSGNRMNLIETHRVADLKASLGWKKLGAE